MRRRLALLRRGVLHGSDVVGGAIGGVIGAAALLALVPVPLAAQNIEAVGDPLTSAHVFIKLQLIATDIQEVIQTKQARAWLLGKDGGAIGHAANL